MSAEARLREQICTIAASMFARGLTAGSSGNISARLDDGRLLVTPTGSSFGALDPGRLSLFDDEGRLVSGDMPTKEMPLHAAFYETRGARTGAKRTPLPARAGSLPARTSRRPPMPWKSSRRRQS